MRVDPSASGYTKDCFTNLATTSAKMGHGQIPLKVSNVKFDVDASVDSIQMLTDSSKSNLTLGTQLHAIIGTHFQLRH